MEPPGPAPTVGAVAVHRPGVPVAGLPAIRGLAAEVDDLVIVANGCEDVEGVAGASIVRFPVNRGTAAAWNEALRVARARGARFLYLLDQDSVPSPGAVPASVAAAAAGPRVGAVVQPPARRRLPLDPFPWNTVASGSLFVVEALVDVGGFDERLFVDEVDHEVLARLLAAGYQVKALPAATIDHRVGSPRPVRFLGRQAWSSGHDRARRRLQGRSAGLLARRYLRSDPATAARLAARQVLTVGKEVAAGNRSGAVAVVRGFAAGAATRHPPLRAAARACPYCGGALLGRFAAVPDWRFGTGPPADVYECAGCRALCAGSVPDAATIASWYANYYTHHTRPAPARPWSRLWPTPRRKAELEQLRTYFTPPRPAGRFLEVGTGSGERLLAFADAGWDVVGQDLDPEAGVAARDRGIAVHRCDVADLVGREAPFDLIGLNHVLEHVGDQEALLRACAALLAPGATLCVVSPNARGLGRILFGRWWFGMEQPRHLAIPTVESLAAITAGLGLDVTHAMTVPTNAAVILGGSILRPLEARLPPGPLRRAARAASALAGQALGRAAVIADRRAGEEVVWVGRRPAAGGPG